MLIITFYARGNSGSIQIFTLWESDRLAGFIIGSKKEADAYDKMLDTADLLDTWLTNSPVQMEDEQREALSLWLAEQKDVLSTILKTGKLPSPQVVGAESEEEDASHAA